MAESTHMLIDNNNNNNQSKDRYTILARDDNLKRYHVLVVESILNCIY